MKLVKWTDDNGYLRQAMLRTSDLDDNKEYGIPLDPPDLSEFGIPEEIRLDLHNELVKRKLVTWLDVQAQQDGVTATVRYIAKRHDLSQSETRQLRRDLLMAYRR